MGFGNLSAGEAAVTALVVAAVWLVPIAMTVWLFRMLSAMTAAQREIAGHLARIEQHVRPGSERAAT